MKAVIPKQRFSNDQQGFGFVGILLVIAILAAVAGTGVYITHMNHRTKTGKSVVSMTSGQKGSTSKTSNASSTEPQQQYLDITQWNVRLPISGSIADAYYVVSTSSQDADGQPNTVWLGLKSLDASGCSASNGNDGKSPMLASIIRTLPTETDPVSGSTYESLYPHGTTIGAYYYGYSAWSGLKQGSVCSSAANVAAINAAFESAAADMSAAN